MTEKVIYMMPGLGASPAIFDGLSILPSFRVKYLHWMMPERNESLAHYVERIIDTQVDLEDDEPILAGMSFGGIIVNEMARRLPVRGLVFISTVKTHSEMPPWFAAGRWLHIYRWFPFGIFRNPLELKKFFPSAGWRKRMDLYDRYLEIRDAYYFAWSVERILKWQGERPQIPWVHIHGNRDDVFPLKYIRPPVQIIPGATHVGIITHPRQIGRQINVFLESLSGG